MAKTRKIRGSNYVQLATVDANGEPRCRTVVFRGFLNHSNHHNNNTSTPSLYNVCDGKPCIMKMCTDSRSQKVQETAQQPMAELVWWFPKTSEQYRIRGQVIMVDSNGGDGGSPEDQKTLQIARKEMWGNLSDPARESFLDTTVVPGEPTKTASTTMPTSSDIPKGGRDDDGNVVQPPPDNFLLLLLNPKYVDYLCLTGDQYRQIDTRDDHTQEWSQQSVNP